MIEKKTILDRIEIANDGHVRVHFALLLMEEGLEIQRRAHNVLIEPGGDVDKAIAAVNADITGAELRAAPIEAAPVPTLKSICGLVHTPDVVKKYRAALAKANAALIPKSAK